MCERRFGFFKPFSSSIQNQNRKWTKPKFDLSNKTKWKESDTGAIISAHENYSPEISSGRILIRLEALDEW